MIAQHKSWSDEWYKYSINLFDWDDQQID